VGLTLGLAVDYSLRYGYGKSINYFIKDKGCWDLIKSKSWNYIVIQDNQRFYYDSLGKFDSMGISTNILANNRKFQDSIKKLVPSVKIIYFAGWEVDGGIPSRFADDNTEKMITRIMKNYKYLNGLGGFHNIIAPIGTAWIAAMQQAPYIARKPYNNMFLYDTDGRHPGWSGSYLAACVLYCTMFHRSPLFLKNKSIFSGEKLDTFLKMTAWQAVTSNYQYSNLGSIVPLVTADSNAMSVARNFDEYQWYYENEPIKGANTYRLVISDPKVSYWVQMTDKKGSVYFSFPVSLAYLQKSAKPPKKPD